MLSRREMLAISSCGAFSPAAGASKNVPVRDGVPAVDYHVHVGGEVSVDRALEVSSRRKIKFGLLQHAGEKGHGYAVSDDDSLNAWVQSLQGKPVFKGIEVESVNWMQLFSKSAIRRLDYVQADALGMPDRSGAPMQIWRRDFRPADPQEFMDRYVDFHVQRISTEPIDILVAPTFLPESLLPDYDLLWTPRRMQAIIDAALKMNVALEIDCRFRVPRKAFLEMAKTRGIQFSFGSNYQTPDGIGDISYCVEMYRLLGLTKHQFFQPVGAGRKL